MTSQVFNYPADEKNRKKAIEALLKKHKSASCFEIGRSVLKRQIYCIQIGDTKSYVLYSGAFHGMEWINSILLLKFADRICELLESNKSVYGFNIREIIEKRGLMIVPCVNPDGVEISINGSRSAVNKKDFIERMSAGKTTFWQANANGVDINHNFNAGWSKLHELERESGITGPSPTRYGGEYPESEPETSAMIKLCRSAVFDMAFAFHSQGEEIYWSFGDTPQSYKKIAQDLALASGYTVSEPEGIAVGGGFKDWFIQEFNKPGFTIETGLGKNPLPLENAYEIYNKIEKMLILGIATFL